MSEPGGNAGFQDPPGDTGRGTGQGYGDEEAVEQYAAPSDREGVLEAAAVSEPADALAGVSLELMEIKRAIEERMRQDVTQAATVRSLDAFHDTGNIQGIAIGLSDGLSATAEPGAPALTVYVAEPSSVDQVKAVVVDSMGVRAAASDSVPMNVVVTGLIDAQPHRFRLRPAPGGISVAHFRVTAGTIGCLSIGRTAPRNVRLMVLSNNHVLANSNNAVFGDCICQPGPADGGRCPADQIAILERFVPINFAGGVNFKDTSCHRGLCTKTMCLRHMLHALSTVA